MSDSTLYESEARAVQRDERPDPRAADPRQAAPPTSGPRLHRRRRSADPFYIDPKLVPRGMTYEWKRENVFGQPDPTHWVGLRENHWRPVPSERHPELAIAGDSIIRRGGTTLCERPSYLTDEARMEDLAEALKPLQQLEEVMYGTKAGELPRDHPSVRKSSFVRQKFGPGDGPGSSDP